MAPTPLIDERTDNGNGRGPFWFSLAFIIGMFCLLALDWAARFDRYEWETRLVRRPPRPVSAAIARPAFTTNQVPQSRGGDLTALVGLRRAAAPFEEVREAGVLIRDQFGYPNRAHPADTRPWAVVVGDSFMATGTQDQLFASRLAEHSNHFIYNMAMRGHGPFTSVERFLDDQRFQDHPPRYLIWGFAEREITGDFFQRFERRLAGRAAADPEDPRAPDPGPPGITFNWDELTPRRLQHSLPDTSFLAQVGQWSWTRIRYMLFQQLHPWVTAAEPDVLGDPMLFFTYHIETLAWPPEKRDPKTVSGVIQRLQRQLDQRDIQLIVVLIPEKEQVYREWIPPHVEAELGPFYSSPLPALARELQEAGIQVVNLLSAFEAATARGERVYWRDDTHWNPAGVELAVDAVWQLIQDAEFGNH